MAVVTPALDREKAEDTATNYQKEKFVQVTPPRTVSITVLEQPKIVKGDSTLCTEYLAQKINRSRIAPGLVFRHLKPQTS
jgi:hypothetical protein